MNSSRRHHYVLANPIQFNSMTNSLHCYEYLYKLKPNISTELFAYYFRNLLQMNTGNVSPELRLKMFEGLNPEDLTESSKSQPTASIA